jgi:formylglycine-generating enzyme required for sulfatase activity
MVVFSASKGQKALDRLSDKDANPNSVFTREFIARMKRPGVRIQDLMEEVRDAVEALAGTVQHEQRPSLTNEARGNFYFFGPTKVQVAPVRSEPIESAAQIEQQGWAAAQSGNTEAGYAAYLWEYPQGRYAGAARIALASIKGKASADKAAGTKQAADSAAKVLADKIAAERVAVERQAASKIASDNVAADKFAADKVAAEKRVVPVAGRIIKDCADCPEMMVIPAGSFMMGSPDIEEGRQPDGREGPVHEVRIGYSFSLGKHELTRGEFSHFATASGYKTEAERSKGCAAWEGKAFAYDASKNWRAPGFAQTDSHPVVCVSWNDAQAYLAWLNQKAPGKGFRLPSEAEWEYAARAGQGTRYPWGDDLSYSRICDFANGMDATSKAQVPGLTIRSASCSDGHAYTAPVGSFKANAVGLYDMHGNAWEWVQDVWHENYRGAPSDGSAWLSGGEQAGRVLRGGAWLYNPGDLRSAYRGFYAPNVRINLTGMRIARTN